MLKVSIMSEAFGKFISGISKITPKMGSIIQEQQQFIRDFLKENPSIKQILETGFHMGLGTATMLDVRPDISVLSFDIFWFEYTRRAKLLLDISYPERNVLIAGNSVCSIPSFLKQCPSYQPDFVFIDGGHERPVPYLDLHLILKHIKPGTYVMIDDYCEEHGAGGVMEAVNEFVKSNILVEAKGYKCYDRGWVMAKRSHLEVGPSALYENKAEMQKVYEDVESHYP
jgi:predicted O-methyltransferase YrrM